MKRMKTMLSILLAAAMILMLAACGGANESTPNSGNDASGETVQSGNAQGVSDQGSALTEDVSIYTKFKEDIHGSKAEYLAQYKPAALAELEELTDGEYNALRDYSCQDPEHPFKYEINKDKNYLVCVGIKKITPEVTIPASVDGIPVLKVNIKNNYPDVTSITLEEGILEIFELEVSNAATVNLPDSLISLSGLATAATELKLPAGLLRLGSIEAPNLTALTLPDGLYELAEGGVSGLNITSLTIPASVVYINSNAVSNNPNLTEVTFAGEGLKMVDGAFVECPNLKEITWPDSVEVMYDGVLEYTPIENMNVPKNLKVFVNGSLGYPAFWGTPYAEKFEDGCIVWNNMLISYTGSNTDIVVPEGVKVILPEAIIGGYNNPVNGEIFSATSITIPGSVELICKWGLTALMPSMENLILEEGVTTIQDSAINFAVMDDSVCHISVPSTLQNITQESLDDVKDFVFHMEKTNKVIETMCEQNATRGEWTCTSDPIE